MTPKQPKKSNPKDVSGVLRALPLACTDERAAVEFIEKHRWGDTPACPRCGSVGVYQMRNRMTGERNNRFLWRCNDCKDQFSVRIGTIFEESRIPLKHWCRAMHALCASKKGISALQISRETLISYKSALFMMHRLRFIVAMNGPAPKLTGKVEADETWVGGKMRPRERQEWGRMKRVGVDMSRFPRYTNKMSIVGDERTVSLES